ncbi:acylphosphatase [Mesoterricola sediminis]|uniref:Acylphosphatase n=1 Tax=Mesoterricola sediminis TaxID=2927980 RepID=A0AA48HGY9_9BACT|nr:acylphosphatase [Mesoterricola sediminis]BDU78033.1 acylphosphatase [Mesoterricola sediminis]
MRIHFHVHGRVQGVGFRWFTLQAARDLDLAGWARNEPDGSVSGQVEGDLGRLDLFREQLAQGPPFARVSRLDWGAVDGGQSLPHPFEIQR